MKLLSELIKRPMGHNTYTILFLMVYLIIAGIQFGNIAFYGPVQTERGMLWSFFLLREMTCIYI